MKNENNIFTYATSELSQDAFLFYLLNFANEDSNEGKLARDFLRTFGCDKINETNFENFKIYSYKQYKHIDVLMLFLKDNDIDNSFLLLVEDKINANESKENQLESYIKEIDKIAQEDINGQKIDDKIYKELEKKETLKKMIIPVYLKTGNMSTQEMEYIKKKATLIDLGKICNPIKDYNGTNIIIKQWKERITRLDELNKKITSYIEKNKTIGEICDLCYNYGCDSLEAMNQIGKAIFDGKHKIGNHSKIYDNDETYNYTTWKENAMGHPEANLSIKPDLLYKKLDDVEYEKENPNEELFISTQLRIRNFDLCVIFEILILNKNLNDYYEYNSWAKKSFLDKNQDVKARFDKEKKDFYEKIDDMIKKNPKFSGTTIGAINNRNIILAKFDWEEWVKNLKFNDFKEYVLELQKMLEETAINCGFEKLW